MIPIVSILSVIIALLVVSSRTNRSPSKGLVWIVYVLLVLIATFRSSEMADYENYYDFFVSADSAERFEAGFQTYVAVVKYFVNSPIFLFFAVALLSIGLKVSAIYHLSPFVWGSLLIYLSNFFILHDMIQIRAAVASGFVLWAAKYCVERDFKSFVIMVIFATLFHNSALIIIPLWLVNAVKPQKTIYLLLLPVSYALALGGIRLGFLVEQIPIESIQRLWMMYQLAMEEDIGVEINLFNFQHLIRCAVCMFMLFHLEKQELYNKGIILWAKMYTIALSLFVLLSDVPVLSFRISELLQIVEILLIPSIVLIPKYHKVGRYAIVVIVGCFLFLNVYYAKLLV